jgi:CubicO group peptidase (beta-lactamase class C family)
MGSNAQGDGTQVLQDLIDAACCEPNGIPGASVVIINRDGKELFAHASGKRGQGQPEPMSLDNIFWIASCTKLITGIALMQLVDQGKLALDDAEQLERLCPELRDVKVLREDGTLEEKKRKITLRMLLTYTGTDFLLVAWRIVVN